MTGAPDTKRPSLGARVAKGAAWMLVWRLCSRVLGLVSTIVMVRLLTPEDFGLVALATSFAVALEAFLHVGVNDVLIREANSDRALFDTGFTINLARSLLIGVVLVAAAWPIATFYDDPRLMPLLLTVAVLALLSGCNNIGFVEFRRDLRFEKEFVFSVVPRIAGIVVSISGAFWFRDYRALIASLIVMRVLTLFLTYWMHPYRPRLSLRAWRRIAGFSIWTWVNSCISQMRDQFDVIAIGRVLGAGSVGIYSVGAEIGALASSELVAPVSAAIYAGFAAGRREGADNRQGLIKAISVTLLVTLPIGLGISMVAAPLITLLFGAKWADAIPLAQVFAALGVTRLIPFFVGSLMTAQAMLREHFWIALTGLIVRVTVLLASIVPLGLMGAVLAAVVCSAVEELLYLTVTVRRFHVRLSDLLRAVWRSVLGGAVMAAAVYAEGIGWASPAVGTIALLRDLGIAAMTGMIVYGAVVLGLWVLCGRPEGPESMALSAVDQAIGKTFRRAR